MTERLDRCRIEVGQGIAAKRAPVQARMDVLTRDAPKRRQEGLRATLPARVGQILAQAHGLSDRLDAGEFDDYADIAPQHGVTRARIAQIMNLLLLAPDIQAEVLDLRLPPGREPVTERHPRQILASIVWRAQREVWATVRPMGESTVHTSPDRLSSAIEG